MYSSKAVRILHAAPVGSGIDVITRALAQELTSIWKQAVVVEARPGGNGLLAGEACSKAAPDGHTLCISSRSTISLVPLVQSKLPYDTEKDFTLMARLFDSVSALFAGAQLPFSTIQGLVEYSRANAGVLNFGAPSEASITLVLLEALRKRHGIEMPPIPYKGVVPMIQAMLTGETHVTFIGLAAAVGPYRAGRIKALAQSGDQRSVLLPGVPTFKEAGLGDIDGGWWFGLFAPRGATSELAGKIHADVATLFSDPSFAQQRLEAQGWIPALLRPQEFAAFLATDRVAMKKLLRQLGMLPV